MGHKSGEFADYSAPMVLTPIETESGGGSRGGGVECHTAGRDARLPLATMVAAQHGLPAGRARCLAQVVLVVQCPLVLVLVVLIVLAVLVLWCRSTVPLRWWLLHAGGSHLPQAVRAVRYFDALQKTFVD